MSIHPVFDHPEAERTAIANPLGHTEVDANHFQVLTRSSSRMIAKISV